MFKKDPALELNIHDPHSPHSIFVPFVPENSTVLDVGCNIGYVGEHLIKNKGCTCDGIDYSEDFLKEAHNRGYRNTYNIDLYKTDFRVSEQYDVLLLLDILEHLPNPYLILKKLVRDNLKSDGSAVICLPNIARIEFRLRHLLGNFEYETSGVMHQDHLRFFTKDSALRMIENTSLTVERVLPTGLGSMLKVFPTLFAFQFVFVCKK